MQKNYRDYTVGELLDMGLKVDVSTHNINDIEKAKKLVSQFEGVKPSTNVISDFTLVRGWKGKFEVDCFVR